MWKACSAILFSIAFHGCIVWVFSSYMGEDFFNGDIDKFAQLDLSAVELSFSEQEENLDSKESSVSAASFMPQSAVGAPEVETVPASEVSVLQKPEMEILNQEKITVSTPPQESLPPPRPAMEKAKIEKEVVMQNPLMPKYPKVSRRKGEEGVVTLMAEVSKSGVVTSVNILKSSGYPRLDAAAVEAMKSAVFHPAQSDGKCVDSKVQLDVNFSLKK
jgi:protein TonB